MTLRHLLCAIGACALLRAAQAALPPDSCPVPSPLPTGPNALTVNATTFTAYTNSGVPFTADFWRDRCPADSTRSVLYVRVGAGGYLVDYPTIIQNGIQYRAEFEPVPGVLIAPYTRAIGFDYRDPYWLNNGPVTLLIKGSIFSQGSLPAYTGSPQSITPQVGLWWNPQESGSGYNIDVKHGVFVMTVYSYTPTGPGEWYITSGPINGNTFTGTLNRYIGGQCISCPYNGLPVADGSPGTVTITFNSPTSATMTLPGGRVTTIEPQAF